MTQTILRVQGLDVYYGQVQALFGVSLDVGRGQVVAILGGNASGKSSTIKSILGLTPIRRGTIHFDGKEIHGRATDVIISRGVGSIPEGRRVFGGMNVHENLLMGVYSRRRESRLGLDGDIERALDYFPHLKKRLGQLAGTLSGGEQQMLVMARAWLRRPKLLCIDEPTMGLSPKYVEHVYDVLRTWKQEGLSILMVDQSANQALHLADYAYVLHNGAVSLHGEAAALARDPHLGGAYLGI